MLRAGLRRRVTGWTWLAARAAVEEAVWRACVMAAIAPAFGLPAALAFSSVGFGVWHARQGLREILSNTVNGAAFAVSYLFGGLPGAVIAHALYNFTLASIVVGRTRQPEPAQPVQGEIPR
jgi:membrane protease YdiL (CAAX protease family)